jgi:hypothetical protein
VYKIGLTATPFLMSVGDLVIGWLLLRGAETALAALARLDGLPAGQDARDRDFYAGKIAAARWFARTVLPELHARRGVVESTDLALMDLPDGGF